MAKKSTKKPTRSRPHTKAAVRPAVVPRRVRPPTPSTEPGPEHFRYLEAVTAAIEGDGDITAGAMAGRLDMTVGELLRFQCERRDVLQWVSDQLLAQSRAMVGPVLRKCAELAAAGSVEHANVLVRGAAVVVVVPGPAPAGGSQQ